MNDVQTLSLRTVLAEASCRASKSLTAGGAAVATKEEEGVEGPRRRWLAPAPLAASP